LAALLSWILAAALVVGAYVIYKVTRNEPVNWIVARNAAGVAALLAFLRAFLDRNRRL
jgi:hypothetical protein